MMIFLRLCLETTLGDRYNSKKKVTLHRTHETMQLHHSDNINSKTRERKRDSLHQYSTCSSIVAEKNQLEQIALYFFYIFFVSLHWLLCIGRKEFPENSHYMLWWVDLYNFYNISMNSAWGQHRWTRNKKKHIYINKCIKWQISAYMISI